MHCRFNTEEYSYENVKRPNNVIGEIYRHILYNEFMPNLKLRPSLFEMSWWHFKKCQAGFPPGTWNCAEDAKRFLELNKTYHFHPG